MSVTFGDIRRQTSGIIQRVARRRRLCNKGCTRRFELLLSLPSKRVILIIAQLNFPPLSTYVRPIGGRAF